MRRAGYRRRFGLPATAVLPLFAPPSPPGAARSTAPPPSLEPGPVALVVFEPGLSRPRRLLARLGTSRMVTVVPGNRPVSLKAVGFVGIGAVTGTIVAQPFDPVTFLAPLYGMVAGSVAAGVGWRTVKGRWSTTISVEEWQPHLDAMADTLRNADRIGQPFVSAAALRVALHSALWHAADAAGQAGGRDVLEAFGAQLSALRAATESALEELDSPSIAARKAAVSERLAAAVDELTLQPATSTEMSGDRATGVSDR